MLLLITACRLLLIVFCAIATPTATEYCPALLPPPPLPLERLIAAPPVSAFILLVSSAFRFKILAVVILLFSIFAWVILRIILPVPAPAPVMVKGLDEP